MSLRRFLFLQGPLSPLFAMIADRLSAAGNEVVRVNLSIGDRMHWGLRRAIAYRGSLERWGEFVDGLMQSRGITDLVVHGERRPYHRVAAERARARGVNVIVTELGYLRPDWMTIERGGTSAGSHFPIDPNHIRRIAAQVPPYDGAAIYEGSFLRVAAPDVAYNLLNTLLWFLYPRFERHTIYFPPLEYAAWLLRLGTASRRRSASERALGDAERAGGPIFLHLMQLEGDFQLREYAPFPGQAEALDMVIGSFATHAPAAARLLIKTHPLDNGLHHWQRVIAQHATRHRVAHRVVLLDGAGLERPLAAARGVVTINSSAGLEALMAGRPVKLLGPAIYDVPGLVDARPLDAFWMGPVAPDARLLGDFVRALAATVQVRGTIYARDGLVAAADAMAERIIENRLNAPDAFVDPPPRLAAFQKR